MRHGAMGRSFPAGCAALGMLAAVSAFAEPAIEEIRLLRSTAEEVEAEIVLPAAVVLPAPGHPGYHHLQLGSIPGQGEPGEPSLPRIAFWVATPPGSRVVVEAEPEGLLFWDRIRPIPVGRPEWIEGEDGKPPIYRETLEESPVSYRGEGSPSAWAEAGEAARMRHLEVVPITVHPARWDPADGTLQVARSLRVRVRFVGTERPPSGRAVASEDPSWERMYRASVLNADQARGWMRAPARATALRAPRTTTDLVKLEVRSSGLRRIGWENLDSLAWAGAGAPLADLRLFEKFYDPDDAADPPLSEVEVPIHLVDADQSGTWTDGDAFYFYAQHVYDRLPEAPWYLKRYGRSHVYWLGLLPGGPNARMEPTSTWLDRNDLPAVAAYPWTEHFEKESEVYGKMGAGAPLREIDMESNIDLGVAAVRTKQAYWLGGDGWLFQEGVGTWYSVDFDLPGFLQVDRFTARLQGFRKPTGSTAHEAHLYLTREAERDTVPLPRTPLTFGYQDSLRYVAESAELAGFPFRERTNRFVQLYGVLGYGAALHWFEVSYQRAPRFVDRRTEISTRGVTGESEFRVATSPAADLVGVEVTDPRAPRVLSIDPAIQVEQVGPSRTLRLQWNLDGGDRRFWLAAVDAVPRPERLELDQPSDLAAPGDQDFIVIAPRAWIPALGEWVAHRESEAGGGHRVLVAAIDDVYDEFSGGRSWPHAVRSFLRALFRARENPPSFLMLVGDACDSFDNRLSMSAPNWVPTQTQFSDSYTSSQGPELVSSDQWFVDDLVGTGEDLDFLPDMHIGRLTASNPAELGAMLSKIIAYEQFTPADDWRNRVLFVSDDAYSSSISFTESYKYNPIEELFRSSARWSGDVIRENGFADMTIDSFYVACYMDSVPGLGRCVTDPGTGRCQMLRPCEPVRTSGDLNEGQNRDYGERAVAPLLWQTMSRGHLFVSFNGHANALLCTHEYILRHDGLAGRVDIDHITNANRPFVFMGYGCHLAEFSRADEALINRGDCLSERMLAAPGRAGIGALASTGYEWLNTTEVYNLAVVRAFFENPPQFASHTRWVLGEIVSRSKANVVALGPGLDLYQSMSATYTSLLDPGLIMDAAGPRLAVTLDGEPISSGTPLTLPAGQDSILFEAHVLDEVWARSFQIADVDGIVDPSRYTVTPDSADDRRARVSYTTTVLPRPYEIVLGATDANGRVSEAAFPIAVDVVFELRRAGAGEWQALAEGERVLEGDSVRVRMSLPRYVPPTDLDLTLDALPMAARKTPQDPGPNGTAREWTLTSLDFISRGGPRTLGAGIAQPDGGSYEVTRRVETDPSFGIEAVYNVPNPFAKETWIFYRLGAQADDVSVRIYTTSGKLIRTLDELPGQPGLNEARWDGRDQDGDAVSNGLYFYKLSVKNIEGSVSRIEKLARVR